MDEAQVDMENPVGGDDSYSSLPYYVLVCVLEQLSSPDVARVACVCKHWRAATLHDNLWRQFLETEFGLIANYDFEDPRRVFLHSIHAPWTSALSDIVNFTRITARSEGTASLCCDNASWFLDTRLYRVANHAQHGSKSLAQGSSSQHQQEFLWNGTAGIPPTNGFLQPAIPADMANQHASIHQLYANFSVTGAHAINHVHANHAQAYPHAAGTSVTHYISRSSSSRKPQLAEQQLIAPDFITKSVQGVWIGFTLPNWISTDNLHAADRVYLAVSLRVPQTIAPPKKRYITRCAKPGVSHHTASIPDPTHQSATNPNHSHPVYRITPKNTSSNALENERKLEPMSNGNTQDGSFEPRAVPLAPEMSDVSDALPGKNVPESTRAPLNQSAAQGNGSADSSDAAKDGSSSTVLRVIEDRDFRMPSDERAMLLQSHTDGLYAWEDEETHQLKMVAYIHMEHLLPLLHSHLNLPTNVRGSCGATPTVLDEPCRPHAAHAARGLSHLSAPPHGDPERATQDLSRLHIKPGNDIQQHLGLSSRSAPCHVPHVHQLRPHSVHDAFSVWSPVTHVEVPVRKPHTAHDASALRYLTNQDNAAWLEPRRDTAKQDVAYLLNVGAQHSAGRPHGFILAPPATVNVEIDPLLSDVDECMKNMMQKHRILASPLCPVSLLQSHDATHRHHASHAFSSRAVPSTAAASCEIQPVPPMQQYKYAVLLHVQLSQLQTTATRKSFVMLMTCDAKARGAKGWEEGVLFESAAWDECWEMLPAGGDDDCSTDARFKACSRLAARAGWALPQCIRQATGQAAPAHETCVSWEMRQALDREGMLDFALYPLGWIAAATTMPSSPQNPSALHTNPMTRRTGFSKASTGGFGQFVDGSSTNGLSNINSNSSRLSYLGRTCGTKANGESPILPDAMQDAATHGMLASVPGTGPAQHGNAADGCDAAAFAFATEPCHGRLVIGRCGIEVWQQNDSSLSERGKHHWRRFHTHDNTHASVSSEPSASPECAHGGHHSSSSSNNSNHENMYASDPGDAFSLYTTHFLVDGVDEPFWANSLQFWFYTDSIPPMLPHTTPVTNPSTSSTAASATASAMPGVTSSTYGTPRNSEGAQRNQDGNQRATESLDGPRQMHEFGVATLFMTQASAKKLWGIL